jgi:hypothetical protein
MLTDDPSAIAGELDAAALMPSVECTLRILQTGGGWKYPQPSETVQAKLDTLVALGVAYLAERSDGVYALALHPDHPRRCWCNEPARPGVAHRSHECLKIGVQ